MIKKLLFAAVTFASTFSFAQESYDFSTIVLADSNTKYTGAEATLTDEGDGFKLVPAGVKNFIELRINNVKTKDQNRVTINYVGNTTTADGLTFKASGTTLTATKVSFTNTSAEYVITDANFKDIAADPGTIQLRARFTSSAGVMASSTEITITSLVVDAEGTLSNSFVTKLDANISASNGTISVEGAQLDAVYSITGQQVASNGLANGVYIVKISKGNASETVKVVMN